jgi:Protein of unknown function (DUF3011)
MICTRSLDRSPRRRSYTTAMVSGALIALCLSQVMHAQSGYGNESRYATTLTCSSDDESRVYCDADTRGGVRLVRRISDSACRQGSTWGYDSRGVWVDKGCRAEFEVAGLGSRSAAMRNASNMISCSSTEGRRVHCDVDTRGTVRLVREIGSSRDLGRRWLQCGV